MNRVSALVFCPPKITPDALRKKVKKGKSKARYRRDRRRNMEQESKGQTYPKNDLYNSFSWFWSNYKRMQDWQNKHKVAYWKSKALALQYENKILCDLLHKFCVNKGLKRKVPYTLAKITSENGTAKKSNEELMDDSTSAEEEEVQQQHNENQFQVSEEMLGFFEKSILHKMEREKQKLECPSEATEDKEIILPPTKQIGSERREEMRILYGEGAPMIIGMETALQLSFDKLCDKKSPKYWPNIPFNI